MELELNNETKSPEPEIDSIVSSPVKE